MRTAVVIVVMLGAGCSKKDDCQTFVDKSKDPVWQALDFSIEEPHRFRYTYESDGKTATATAIGDLDCDGTAITYTLSATAPDGTPTVQITEPPANAD
jgi:hypothetical protein